MHVLPDRYPGMVSSHRCDCWRSRPYAKGTQDEDEVMSLIKTRFDHKKSLEKASQSTMSWTPAISSMSSKFPMFNRRIGEWKDASPAPRFAASERKIIFIQLSPDRCRPTAIFVRAETRPSVHRLGLLWSPGPAPKPSHVTTLPSPESGALRTGCAGPG